MIINDMVIFPNNEVRIEYDNNYDKQMVDIVDKIEDNLMLIVNPINDDNIDVTSFPKYGILGRLKLKMNVPNGKTRIVIEGLDRMKSLEIILRLIIIQLNLEKIQKKKEHILKY